MQPFRAPLVLVLTGVSLGLFTGAPARAAAQEPGVTGGGIGLDPRAPLSRLHIDLWMEKDGLPQNMASAIAQGPDGYLWLGMEEGLVRFDGVRFRIYGPAASSAFATPWVTALLAEPDGTILIGTGGGGLVRMRDDTFTAFTTDDGLTHDHVRSVLRDRDGVLWIGTHGGGAVRLRDGAVDTLDVRRGLSGDFVLSMAQDSAGAVWLGTTAGLSRVDEDGITVFRTADGLPDDHVQAVLAGRDGSVWAGTTEGGLARFRDGRFTTLSTADGLSSDYVTSLYEDPAGALWIGTNGGGLNRYHDGRIESIDGGSGLPGDLVLSLGGDREGSVWLGLTGTGLARLRESAFTMLGRAEGLSADIALAVLEDRRGDMWIGTPGGGLNRLRDGRVSAITTEQGLAHDVVIGLAETHAGDIWVGMAGGGISRIRDGRVATFGLEDGLVSTRVIDFAEDADGSLWLATLGAGIQRWRPADRAAPPFTYTRADGLPDDYVTTLHLAADGTLWAGTRGGLAAIDEQGGITAIAIGGDGEPSNVVTDLYEDADGTIWVATSSGLARVRRGDVVLYDGTAGPFDREIHGIVEDSLGHLWLSSNQGLARVRKADLDAVADGRLQRVPFDRFDTADGMRSAEANGGINPAATARRDGTLWFPTMRGVAIVDPGRVRTGRAVPAPILEEVAAADSVWPLNDPLSLPPGTRSLEFHFTAPTFSAPGEVAFRYMLEGFDAAWVDAGTRRVAYYTNVPPGPYRFRVATRRGAGAWNEAEAAVDLVLAPRFFERPWFLALSAWCLIALAVFLYRLRIHALTRRQQELMDLMAERARTERALRSSEERLRLALEAGRMGTWEWDISTGRISTSRTATIFFGFEPTTLDEVLTGLEAGMTPEDHQRLAALPDLVRAGQTDVALHFPLISDDGLRRHIELRGRATRNAAGGLVRVAGVVVDVTEVMNAQEELRQREEELRQAQKMEAVGRLAGGVAHDFNNLLTAIAGRTHLVLEALQDDELRQDIEEIRDATERAANLTQQLLTFSRKQVHRPTVLDLNAVIDGVERMVRRLIRDDVVLETRLVPDIGRVHADPGGLEQILLNLVVNAQDAMPDGGHIRIETRSGHLPSGTSEDDDGTPEWVILSVSDTGQGMSAETQKQVFEPFFTTKPVGKGTGLGLATVYGIVHQNGGHIRLASEIGRGTRFHIYLPAVADAGPGRPRYEGGRSDRNGWETVLLVEDEPAVRSLVRKILERRGYTVLDAPSGIEALEICRDEERHIHLLVSDVVMPHIGGRELAEQILLARPDIRVLLMSGYNEDEVLRRGIPGSGMEFIQKPFEPDAFARRIRAILDARVRA